MDFKLFKKINSLISLFRPESVKILRLYNLLSLILKLLKMSLKIF